MRAMSAFRREAGISTRVCLALTAFRSRVSISAIGSVISQPSQLVSWWVGELGIGVRSGIHSPSHQFAKSPTTFRHPGDVALERQLAEAQAAEGELSHVGARPATEAASIAQPDLELR